jgi:hypothetical protein
MSRAALMNEGVLCLMILMTALLASFIYQIVRLPPELARPAEQSVLNLPEPPPPAPPVPALPLPARRPRPPLPARRSRPAASVTGAAGPPGQAGHPVPGAAAAVPVSSRPKVSGAPPWGPAPRPPGLDEAAGYSMQLSAPIPADPPAGQPAGPGRWHHRLHGDPVAGRHRLPAAGLL